jgi:hypothetical protein
MAHIRLNNIDSKNKKPVEQVAASKEERKGPIKKRRQGDITFDDD